MHARASSPLTLLLLLLLVSKPSTPTARLESFVYVGCSQQRFEPNTPYESNVNSILASLVNSASMSNFNNFKMGSTQNDFVYGVFQCRGDLSTPDCRHCIAAAITRLGTYCTGASGGALQLEGCFVKYDNTNFLGVEDKTVVSNKCGPSVGYDSDLFGRRDAVLGYLTGSGQYFRVGGSGKLQGIVQCVQDLSMSECQDCLSEAIGRLRSECGSSTWGDMFLGKCYARYSERGYTSRSGNNDVDKTLAIIIGIIVAVAILVVFLSFLSKSFDKKGGGK